MTAWLHTYLIVSALAAGSSYVQLRRGCVEANPLMPARPAWNLAAKASTTTGFVITYRWVGTRNPKLGKILTGIGIGVTGADAVHNMLVRCR